MFVHFIEKLIQLNQTVKHSLFTSNQKSHKFDKKIVKNVKRPNSRRPALFFLVGLAGRLEFGLF